MRIAIVGTGVSGLVVARNIHAAHEVTLFEADQRIGGHVHTWDVAVDGRNYAVDSGFIVYNERNYPNFSRLLAELGVATQPSTMSFSVRSDADGLEYNGTTVKQLFVQRRNAFRPRFLRMRADEIGRHYAETLRRWREAFHQNRHRIAALGFDARFQRLWDFYFCYCEGGFLERAIGTVQLSFAKAGAAAITSGRLAPVPALGVAA